MSFDGAGNYIRNYNWTQDAANSIPITASRFDAEHNGFAAGLSNCITRDGQGKPIADISWNGHKITGLADPSLPQDAMTLAFANSNSGLLNLLSTRVKYDITPAETAAIVTPVNYYTVVGNAYRNNANPKGSAADATTALQTWLDTAWAQYNYTDTQGLWNGDGGANPIAELNPGKYKLSDTLIMPVHTTLRGRARGANTVNHTRLIMDSTATSPPNGAGDNRNKPILKFQRGTVRGGGVLADPGFVSTIENMEFWYVTIGGSFANPLGGSTIVATDYPLGGSIYIDVDVTDTRIVGCCFQHSPAGIRIKNVPLTPGIRGDGFTGNRGVNMYIEDCEFDTGGSHIYAEGSYLDIHFTNCKFFGGMHKYIGCTGKVIYDDCQFFGNSWIDASDSGNAFSVFRIGGGDMGLSTAADTVSVRNATIFDMKDVTVTGASGGSCLVLEDCSGGSVSNNSINDSGFNASAGTGLADFVAAIKMRGCRNMSVIGNNITATDAASYNGFGILLGDSAGRTSQKNFVDGNCVSAPYAGANFNGQTRHINVTALDVLGTNYNPNLYNVQRIGPASQIRVAVTYSASMTINAAAGTRFEITATNGTAFTINAPTNPTEGQEIEITIINTSGGALGVLTWNAVFRFSTWTQPINATNRAIAFIYNGTNWVEKFRSSADVPN